MRRIVRSATWTTGPHLRTRDVCRVFGTAAALLKGLRDLPPWRGEDHDRGEERHQKAGCSQKPRTSQASVVGWRTVGGAIFFFFFLAVALSFTDSFVLLGQR